MNEEDKELENLKAIRLAEMQKNLSFQEKQKEIEDESNKDKKQKPTLREYVVKSLGHRGIEVLQNAESQFPNESKIIIEKLGELVASGDINISYLNVTGVTTVASENVTDLNVTGVCTATSFVGSGANLTDIVSGISLQSAGSWISAGTAATTFNFQSGATLTNVDSGITTITITSAGLGTPVNTDSTDPMNRIYYTNKILDITSTSTVDVPSSAIVGYTQHPEIAVSSGIDLIIADGDADGELDVTIGAGTSSVTTIAGTLTMGSTAALVGVERWRHLAGQLSRATASTLCPGWISSISAFQEMSY